MTFAEQAGRLAGVAGWLLGWGPEAFWRATPAELAAIFGAMAGSDEEAAVDGGELARLRTLMPD